LLVPLVPMGTVAVGSESLLTYPAFDVPRCQAEVASVYAEAFHRLGYLVIDNLVSDERWHGMTSGLRGHFEDHDVSRSEAARILGEPTLVVDRKILCYAPADPAAGWLFVDCHAERSCRHDVGHGRYTAVGVDRPGESWSEEKAAIASQLREISAADPSRSARRPGG
jgi:hypothetical protein